MLRCIHLKWANEAACARKARHDNDDAFRCGATSKPRVISATHLHPIGPTSMKTNAPDAIPEATSGAAVNRDRQLLAALIDNVFFCEPLFDALPDVVFFVKDEQGRY